MADDERLAPVTYLFGAATPQPEAVRSSSAVDNGFARVSNVSMSALARRGMSSEEMRTYLLDREFDSDTVEAEIERLELVQLLDDEHLAETLVRTLRERKGLGRGAISAELRKRRIDPVIIEVALEDSGDEASRATELAVKRVGQMRGLDRTTAERRLSAFLMRKGYSGSVVSSAVAAALQPTGPVFR